MDNFDNKYKKKNPFSVPEGYFEQLEDRLMECTESSGKSKNVKFLQVVKPYLGLAAVFIVALLVVQLVLPLVVDKHQVIVKQGDRIAQNQELVEENIFDSQFNPTNEEIIEYLSSEMDSYELLYAVNY